MSIVTLVYLILFSWKYDSRQAYITGRVESIDKEIDRIQQTYNGQRQQDWQLIETYRLETQAIRVEIARAGIDLKLKPATNNKKEK